MATQISYFIILGVISIVNGKPAADDSVAYAKGEFEIQKILQLLADEGKYDIVLSHHEDGPKSHHEDKARILQYSGDKHRDRYNRHEKQYPTQYYDSVEDADYTDNHLQHHHYVFKNNADKQYRSNANDVLNRLLSLDSNNHNLYKAREEEENNEDIVAFLNDLQKNIADDGNFVSKLRCAGNRCERDRNNRNDNNEDDNTESLRCNGNNCPSEDRKLVQRDNKRFIYDISNVESLNCYGNNCKSKLNEAHGLNLDSKLLRNKIKLSNDLDAVVLGMSDVDRLLSKTSSPNLRQLSKLKRPTSLENGNLENLLNGQGNNIRSNVEAVVFDLTRVDNGDVVATQIKDILSGGNEGRDDEYDDYVNIIAKELHAGANDAKPNKKKYKILPHNEDNNNVYVPQWLVDEIYSESDLGKSDVIELLKSFFPQTIQQRKRQQIRLEKQGKKPNRRNFDLEVGVPFHFELQGLGQVNPNAP